MSDQNNARPRVLVADPVAAEGLEILRDFADVVDDVTFPSFDYDAITGTIIRAEGASAFLDLLESGRARELQCPSDRWGGYAAMTVLAVDYLQAMRIRSKVQQTLDKLYADFDALVSPARATVAYPISVNFQKAYPEVKGGAGPAVIPAGNLAGQPAISVPTAWDPTVYRPAFNSLAGPGAKLGSWPLRKLFKNEPTGIRNARLSRRNPLLP